MGGGGAIDIGMIAHPPRSAEVLDVMTPAGCGVLGSKEIPLLLLRPSMAVIVEGAMALVEPATVIIGTREGAGPRGSCSGASSGAPWCPAIAPPMIAAAEA
jgi:hypothetical protein